MSGENSEFGSIFSDRSAGNGDSAFPKHFL